MAGKDPMPPAPPVDTRFTYDDLVLFPDDGKRHELIDGDHYVTPSPNVRHQVLVGRLHLALGNYLATRPEVGRVFLAPLDVVFSPYDVVEPDLLFVAGDQVDILTPKNIQGSPALVVEVLSDGTRKVDAKIKRRLFERMHVREYWLIDPVLDTIQIFRASGAGRMPKAAELSMEDGDVLTSALLPGFTLALRTLFEPGL